MNKGKWFRLVLITVFLVALTTSGHNQVAPTPDHTLTATQGSAIQASTTLGHLPLRFEANQGQFDPQVHYLARGQGYTVFITAQEAVVSLFAPSPHQEAPSRAFPGKPSQAPNTAPQTPSTILHYQLRGANPTAQLVAQGELSGKTNYFLGNDPSKWRTDVLGYTRVSYNSVYPGIDLAYYGSAGSIEYDFNLAPGADPTLIRFAITGATKVSLEAGELVLHTGAGDLHQRAPHIYQDGPNGRTDISGGYQLLADGSVGFAVAAYDPSRKLVIDPVLDYSTYLGGSGTDRGTDMALDNEGNIYVMGRTDGNFPLHNPFQPTVAGQGDLFVSKISADGQQLIYSTYLGGSGTEDAGQMAVDSQGNVYLTGDTFSRDFPLYNPLQRQLNGDTDGFVTKLSASGAALVYSTYIGGSGIENTAGIQVGADGSAYVVGSTNSTDFPLHNPYQSQNMGGFDAFVFELNPGGSALTFSTYLGGGAEDYANSIAVANNAIWVAGFTNSGSFPSLNPLQPSYGGGDDAFVTRFDATGQHVTFSTFLGGSGDDAAYSLDLDASGNLYIAGQAAAGFPLVNPVQPNFSGHPWNAFVAEINSTATQLVYSTYLGGSGQDQATGIKLDGQGNIYMSGVVDSTDYPLRNPIQSTYGGGVFDSVITELNPTGSQILFSTYLGGSGWDAAEGLAVTNDGYIYVAGDTESPNYPVYDALQPVFGGGADAFISRIAPTDATHTPTATPGGPTFTPTSTTTPANPTNTPSPTSTPRNTPTITPPPIGGCSVLSFAASNYAVGTSPRSVAVGDFNGDNKPDIVAANYNSSSVSVLLNNGSGGFGAATNYEVSSYPGMVAVGDFNHDSRPDLVVLNTFSSTVQVLLNNGTGFGTATSYAVGGGPSGMATGDFNGDGKLDLVVTSYLSNTVSVLLGNGDGTFGAATIYAAGSGTYSVAVGDFNADGKLDLAITHSYYSNDVSVLLGNGDGTFGTPTVYPVGALPRWLVVADLNGDGIPDLAVASYYDHNVSVLLGNGNGTFQPAINYPAGNVPTWLAVGDFNLDGKPDLVATDHDSNSVGVLVGLGDGSFLPPVGFPVSGQLYSVAVADFNGDGKPDMVVQDWDHNIVSVLLNTCIAATATPTATGTPPTATPSDTPTPTATPGGPTNTPLPTNTPTVTGTPQTATPSPTDCLNPFVDINNDIFYYAIHSLYCQGIVSGVDPSHYDPAGFTTRAQFTKVLASAFPMSSYTPTGRQDFTDVPPSYFAYAYIESSFHAGIISGFDQATCAAHNAQYPCFLPNQSITRGQLTKLVVLAAGYPLTTPSGGGQDFTDVPPSNPFFIFIHTAYAKGIVSGYPDHTFHPNAGMRRDEMAEVVYKAITTP